VEPILYEKKGRIAYITLNRPEVLNAHSREVKLKEAELFREFQNDSEVWIGIVSGAGERGFCAGSDVKEMAQIAARGEDFFAASPPEPVQEGLFDVWKPLIAAIQGWCVGGGLELAIICDIRIATEDARFGLMEPRVGWPAGGGGTVRLPNQIPFAVAMEMILTGESIDARRAYEVGLINQVVPTFKDLMPAAERMAERILECAPLAVRYSKEQALRSFGLPNYMGLPMRKLGALEIANSADAKEGATAFAEKRKPNWQGK
jgi:enoyl-CoA hydratase/carnithine racemase